MLESKMIKKKKAKKKNVTAFKMPLNVVWRFSDFCQDFFFFFVFCFVFVRSTFVIENPIYMYLLYKNLKFVSTVS